MLSKAEIKYLKPTRHLILLSKCFFLLFGTPPAGGALGNSLDWQCLKTAMYLVVKFLYPQHTLPSHVDVWDECSIKENPSPPSWTCDKSISQDGEEGFWQRMLRRQRKHPLFVLHTHAYASGCDFIQHVGVVHLLMLWEWQGKMWWQPWWQGSAVLASLRTRLSNPKWGSLTSANPPRPHRCGNERKHKQRDKRASGMEECIFETGAKDWKPSVKHVERTVTFSLGVKQVCWSCSFPKPRAAP